MARETKIGSPYFVNKESRWENMSKHEDKINKTYTDFVKKECIKEKQKKAKAEAEARSYVGIDAAERMKMAQNTPTAYCDKYQNMMSNSN